jgi:hypothetical protein
MMGRLSIFFDGCPRLTRWTDTGWQPLDNVRPRTIRTTGSSEKERLTATLTAEPMNRDDMERGSPAFPVMGRLMGTSQNSL